MNHWHLTDLILAPNISKRFRSEAELMVIEAKYENGVFRPIGEVKLKEGTLVEIHVNRGQTAGKPLSIRELGFAGMWADRADIKDGVSYVNSLRDRPRD